MQWSSPFRRGSAPLARLLGGRSLSRRAATVIAVAVAGAASITALTLAGAAAPAVPPSTAIGSGVSTLPDVSPDLTTTAPTPWLTPSKSPTPTPTVPPLGAGGSDYDGAVPYSTGPVAVTSATFGMHVEQRDSSAWPDVAVGAYRILNADSTWGSLEPSPGSWNWGPLDTRVANAGGAPVLLVMSHPPTWASSRPDLHAFGGSPAPPRDMGEWRTYVRTVAQRYAGRIEAYEIWNEANLTQFYTGTPGQLAELTIAAEQEIHAVDGSARVVSSGLSARTGGAEAFFSAYLGATPSSAIDVVGIHIYPYPGSGPESMLGMLSRFKSLASSAGHGGEPMWNTEIGYGRTPDSIISGDGAASLILRTYLVLPAYGLPRNYWYKWDDHTFVGLYLTNSDRSSASAAGVDYGTAERWLAGSTILGCGESRGFWRCDVERSGAKVAVVWHLSGEASYPAPTGTTVMYRFGGGATAVGAGAPVGVGSLPVLFAPAAQTGLSG